MLMTRLVKTANPKCALFSKAGQRLPHRPDSCSHSQPGAAAGQVHPQAVEDADAARGAEGHVSLCRWRGPARPGRDIPRSKSCGARSRLSPRRRAGCRFAGPISLQPFPQQPQSAQPPVSALTFNPSDIRIGGGLGGRMQSVASTPSQTVTRTGTFWDDLASMRSIPSRAT